MKKIQLSRETQTFLTYLAGGFLSLFFFAGLSGHFNLHLNIPFAYDGDVLFSMTLMKSLAQGEWFPYTLAKSSFLGTPYGMTMADFPESNHLHYFFILFLSLFTHDPASIYNGYYLLTFPLTTLSFIYAATRFRIPNAVALVMGLLYSFLPFHLIRFAHIFLASYFMIPLSLMVVLHIWSKRPLLFALEKSNSFRFSFNQARVPLTIAFLTAASGVYYAYFFSFFSLIAGISASLYRKNKYHLISALMIIGVTIGSAGLSIVPNILYNKQHGKNSIIATRYAMEAEIYGLKLKNIFVPRENHRIEALGKIRKKHGVNHFGGVEGADETIGIIGVAGFFLLLLPFFYLNRFRSSSLNRLALLQINGTLLALTGGLSVFIAALVTSKIRCYNRISIYLACISLLGIAFALKHVKRYLNQNCFHIILIGLLAFGLFDQLTPDYANSYDLVHESYESDHDFFSEVEKLLQKTSLGQSLPQVLQLPYMVFPEGPFVEKITPYSHFRGFLHTQKTRWSFGAVHGRPGANEIQSLSNLPLDLQKIRAAGYSGIYIDRFGYPDQAKALEEALSQELKESPLVSKNGRMSFFLLQK